MVKGRERGDGDGRSGLGDRLKCKYATNKQTSRYEQIHQSHSEVPPRSKSPEKNLVSILTLQLSYYLVFNLLHFFSTCSYLSKLHFSNQARAFKALNLWNIPWKGYLGILL